MIERFKLVGGPRHGEVVNVMGKPADIRVVAKREANCMKRLGAGDVYVVVAEYRYIRRLLNIEQQDITFYIWEHTPDEQALQIILYGAKP